MPEFEPTNLEEIEKGEKWYLKKILDAIHEDNLEEVLSTLQHAWSSAYDITQVPVKILEETYNPSEILGQDIDSLQNILEEYFAEKIRSGFLDTEDRKRIYDRMLPYDIDLAHSMIKRIRDGYEYNVGFSDVLNPTELHKTQVSHYQYIIDNGLGVYQLYGVLRNDGHLDDKPPYDLGIAMKRKIMKYARDYIDKNYKNQDSPEFLKAKQLRDFLLKQKIF